MAVGHRERHRTDRIGWLRAPPPLFFVYLIGVTVAYLALVEIAKGFFFRARAGR